MAAWLCKACSTVFSVDAPCCPHCGTTDHVEQGAGDMPKITAHGGPSIAGASVVGGSWSSEGDPDVWPESAGEEVGEESSPGSNSETSPETPPNEPEPSEKPSRSPARTTASRSKKAATAKASTAPSTDGGLEADTSAADATE